MISSTCKILRLKHYLHAPLEKSLIEKDSTAFKELNLLMIITHAIVKEEVVRMVMCITG
jgi:hypothetical protein